MNTLIEDNKDILEPWILIDGIQDQIMFIEAIHDDYEGFRILLQGENKNSNMLRIVFDNKLSYRNTNESYLLKIWHTNRKEILGKVFYIISNSSYIDFFHEMTGNIYNDWNLKHYAIYTITDCLDIISCYPPKIEWLN